jgi:hypothetical protein
MKLPYPVIEVVSLTEEIISTSEAFILLIEEAKIPNEEWFSMDWPANHYYFLRDSSLIKILDKQTIRDLNQLIFKKYNPDPFVEGWGLSEYRIFCYKKIII